MGGSMMRLAAMILAFWLPAQTDQPGDTYELVSVHDTQTESEGSTGSTHDQDSLQERVIAVRDGGLILEYDLPPGTSEDDRARNWQFPVRVLKPANGPMQLLNEAELAARVDKWLAWGGLTRAACGHWGFSWTAYRIECDPKSVIRLLETYDLRPGELRDGAPFRDPGARAAAALVRTQDSSGRAIFKVELAIDPETVRRERAETDVAVAEINRKPVTLETALQAHAKEQIAGTITITFLTDAAGQVRRRTRLTRTTITPPGGRTETQTSTETLERRPATRRPAADQGPTA